MIKDPGPGGMRLRHVPLDMSFADAFGVRNPDAYERLLMDVVRGSQTLFMRRDEVEAAWAWIDPILEAWAASSELPKSYTSGTWGPSAAVALIERDGRTWYEDQTMIEAERVFAAREALADALASDVAEELRRAIAAKGKATLAVSGGSTPKLFFEKLSEIDLPWQRVTVTLVDERQVPEISERSNARLVRQHCCRTRPRRRNSCRCTRMPTPPSRCPSMSPFSAWATTATPPRSSPRPTS